MMPVVRNELIKCPITGRTFNGNIVLDKFGRECTWIVDGYYLLKKDGTVSKKKTMAWD
jgi:hypothetical protein